MDDESLEACAYREIGEELGLSQNDMTRFEYFSSVKAPYEWQDSTIINIVTFFTATLTNEQSINLNKDENTEMKWISEKDIDSTRIAWEADKIVLRKLLGEAK